jgi:hypothetical protein
LIGLNSTKDVGAVSEYDSILLIGQIDCGAGAVWNTTTFVAWTAKLELSAA